MKRSRFNVYTDTDIIQYKNKVISWTHKTEHYSNF